MSPLSILALTALVAPVQSADAETEIRTTLTFEVTVEADGQAHTAATTGWLHAFMPEPAPGGLDPYLRVLDSDGELLAEDDSSGDLRTPYVSVPIQTGDVLTFELRARELLETDEAPSDWSLTLVELHQLKETALLAKELEPRLDEMDEALQAKRFSEARALAQSVYDTIVASPDAETSLAAFFVLARLGDPLMQMAFDELGVEVWTRLATYSGKVWPRHHTDYLSARGNLGVVLTRTGRLQEALDAQEEILEIAGRYYEPNHEKILTARENAGEVLVNLGQTHRSLEYFRLVHEARSGYERTDPRRLRSQQAYATLLSMTGDDERAFELTEQAYLVQLEFAEPDSTALQGARYNYAYQLRLRGRHHEAREILEQAEAAYASKLPPEHMELLKLRFERAANMYKLGDFQTARSLMERVLEQMSAQLPEDDRSCMVVRRSLAAVYRAEGDLEGARQLQERILEIQSRAWSEDHLEFQYMLLDRAILHQDFSEWELAYEFADRAIRGLLRYLPPDHEDILRATSVQAWTLANLDRGSDALELTVQVFQGRKAEFGDGHPRTLRSSMDLGWQMAELGMVEELDELVRFAARGYARYLTRTSVTLSMREAESLPLDNSFQFGLRGVMNLVTRLPEDLREAGQREAFLLAETTRGLASTTRRRAQLAATDEVLRELAGERSRLSEASEQVARLVRSGAAETVIREAVLEKERAERDLQEAIFERTNESVAMPQADVEKIAARLAPDEVAVAYWKYRRTDIGTPALEFRRAMLAFVVRPDGTLHRVELGFVEDLSEERENADEIDHDLDGVIERWRVAMANAGADADTKGRELRERIFDPIAAVAGDAKRWIVTLDGQLHLVPLDALPASQGVVGDSVTIEVRSTLSELTLALGPVSGPPRLLAFGGVDYDTTDLEVATVPTTESLLSADDLESSLSAAPALVLRGTRWEMGFPPLPDTGLEVQEIRELWSMRFPEAPEPQLFEGSSASHANLLALAPGSRYVHLATHGFYAPEYVRSERDPNPVDRTLGIGRFTTLEEGVTGMSPMALCGLALAGANRSEANAGVPGIVTAEELGALDLASCELAVLSACDTGVGVVHTAGQGVASLQKALHAAGARSVLTSLWKVPDQATRELMTEFYRGLWVEGLSKSEALWQAKRTLRAQRLKPRDWAGWVLSGETR